jgi:hypothetical protein
MPVVIDAHACHPERVRSVRESVRAILWNINLLTPSVRESVRGKKMTRCLVVYPRDPS